MTVQEAGQVMSVLNAIFYRESLEPETVAWWTSQIAELKDFNVALATAEGFGLNATKLPAFAEFKQAYQAQRQSGHATNELEASGCKTCGGDRFVTITYRPAVTTIWMHEHGIKAPDAPGMEEVAGCPDCNPVVNADFRRADGSWFRGLDPARVRERMQQ